MNAPRMCFLEKKHWGLSITCMFNSIGSKHINFACFFVVIGTHVLDDYIMFPHFSRTRFQATVQYKQSWAMKNKHLADYVSFHPVSRKRLQAEIYNTNVVDLNAQANNKNHDSRNNSCWPCKFASRFQNKTSNNSSIQSWYKHAHN